MSKDVSQEAPLVYSPTQSGEDVVGGIARDVTATATRPRGASMDLSEGTPSKEAPAAETPAKPTSAGYYRDASLVLDAESSEGAGSAAKDVVAASVRFNIDEAQSIGSALVDDPQVAATKETAAAVRSALNAMPLPEGSVGQGAGADLMRALELVEEGDEEAEGLGVDARSSAVSVGNLSDGRLAEVAPSSPGDAPSSRPASVTTERPDKPPFQAVSKTIPEEEEEAPPKGLAESQESWRPSTGNRSGTPLNPEEAERAAKALEQEAARLEAYSRPQTAASSDIMPDIVVALLEKVKEVRRQEADAAFMAEEAKRQQVEADAAAATAVAQLHSAEAAATVAQDQSEAAEAAANEVKQMCDEAAEALQAAKDGGASAEEIEAAEKALAAAQEGYKEALGFAEEARQHMRAARGAAEVARQRCDSAAAAAKEVGNMILAATKAMAEMRVAAEHFEKTAQALQEQARATHRKEKAAREAEERRAAAAQDAGEKEADFDHAIEMGTIDGEEALAMHKEALGLQEQCDMAAIEAKRKAAAVKHVADETKAQSLAAEGASLKAREESMAAGEAALEAQRKSVFGCTSALGARRSLLAGGDDQFAEMTASLEARRATVAQSESAFAESRKTMVAEVTDFDRRKSTAHSPGWQKPDPRKRRSQSAGIDAKRMMETGRDAAADAERHRAAGQAAAGQAEQAAEDTGVSLHEAEQAADKAKGEEAMFQAKRCSMIAVASSEAAASAAVQASAAALLAEQQLEAVEDALDDAKDKAEEAQEAVEELKRKYEAMQALHKAEEEAEKAASAAALAKEEEGKLHTLVRSKTDTAKAEAEAAAAEHAAAEERLAALKAGDADAAELEAAEEAHRLAAEKKHSSAQALAEAEAAALAEVEEAMQAARAAAEEAATIAKAAEVAAAEEKKRNEEAMDTSLFARDIMKDMLEELEALQAVADITMKAHEEAAAAAETARQQYEAAEKASEEAARQEAVAAAAAQRAIDMAAKSEALAEALRSASSETPGDEVRRQVEAVEAAAAAGKAHCESAQELIKVCNQRAALLASATTTAEAKSEYAAVQKAAVDATREAKAAEGVATEAAQRFAIAQACAKLAPAEEVEFLGELAAGAEPHVAAAHTAWQNAIEACLAATEVKKEAKAKCAALEQSETAGFAAARAAEEEVDAQEELALILRATAREVRKSLSLVSALHETAGLGSAKGVVIPPMLSDAIEAGVLAAEGTSEEDVLRRMRGVAPEKQADALSDSAGGSRPVTRERSRPASREMRKDQSGSRVKTEPASKPEEAAEKPTLAVTPEEGQKPAEEPEEKPEEKPAETAAEKPAEEPEGAKPAEEPSATGEKPAEEPPSSQKPAEAPAAEAAAPEKPAEVVAAEAAPSKEELLAQAFEAAADEQEAKGDANEEKIVAERLRSIAERYIRKKMTARSALLAADGFPDAGTRVADAGLLRVCLALCERALLPSEDQPLYEQALAFSTGEPAPMAPPPTLPFCLQCAVLRDEMRQRFAAGDALATVLVDTIGPKKSRPGKLAAALLEPCLSVDQWPLTDPEKGAEVRALFHELAELFQSSAPVAERLDLESTQQPLNTEIQAWYETLAQGFGAGVRKEKDKFTQEVKRRLLQVGKENEHVSSDINALAPNSDTQLQNLLVKMYSSRGRQPYAKGELVVRALRDAVKDIPGRERDHTEMEVIYGFMPPSPEDVDITHLVFQARMVFEVRAMVASGKDLRMVLRTLSSGKSAYLTNANLILVLEELAEGKEEKLQTCLLNAAKKARAGESVATVLRTAAAGVDPQVAAELRRAAAKLAAPTLTGMALGKAWQQKKSSSILTGDTAEMSDVEPMVVRSMFSIVTQVFDEMDAEDAEGGIVAPKPGSASGLGRDTQSSMVTALTQLIDVKERQLSHDERANREVSRLRDEMEQREQAHQEYLVRLKQSQHVQSHKLMGEMQDVIVNHRKEVAAMREAADAREKFLQEELARMKRRSEQRVRLLQERMDRKDLSMATELTTQQVTAQKKEKSFEIELGRRRREISEKDERYDQDTSTLRAEIHALRDNVSSQRDQISGISKDLAIFSKAMVVMDNQRAVDSQTIVELTQKTLRPAEPDSPNDLLATLETEPELEPAQDERTASAEQPGMGDTWAHSTRSGFGMQSKLAPQPQHLDTLAQLYSTQATLDFTQAQCTKQEELLRHLRVGPGTEREAVLEAQVEALKRQLEGMHDKVARGDFGHSKDLSGLHQEETKAPKYYELSKYAPRTMRAAAGRMGAAASVPTLPPVPGARKPSH